MKKLYKLAGLFAIICLFLPNTSIAQVIKAGVGIDADVYSNRQHFGGGSTTPGYLD